MMNKVQGWINTAIAIILVGELLLFSISFLFPIQLLFLKQSWPIQVFVGYCVVLLNLKIQTWPIPLRIIALGIVLPLCCWTTISFSDTEKIQQSVQLGENRYFLTMRTPISVPFCDFFCDHTPLTLYKCNSMGMDCKIIYNDNDIDVAKSGLAVDKNANELQLFLSYSEGAHGCPCRPYGLYYVYGKQPRFIQDSVEFADSIYHLAIEELNTYTLLKCNLDSTGCKRLPFEYIDKNTDDFMMIYIDDTDKLSITASGYGSNSHDWLVYTYDIHSLQPVCHITGCELKN